MTRTTTFSLRLTAELRKKIEEYAEILRLKPSVFASMVLRDCSDQWTKEYTQEIFDKIHANERRKR